MAGIKEAMQRVSEHRNIGKTVALGTLKECDCKDDGSEQCSDCSNYEYIIIRLEDGGLITQYDYGSDIRISSNIEVGDRVILILNDNWSAMWKNIDDANIPDNASYPEGRYNSKSTEQTSHLNEQK